LGRSNRRQGRPSSGGGGGRSPTPPSSKPAWRETFDSWGGLPVFGSIAAVLVVIGLLIYSNRPGASVGAEEWVPIERVAVNGRSAGDPSAPVKIVAFEDFQCPFCQKFTHETEPALLEEFVNTGKVQIQFVPYSFLGEESKKAAEAAECAADQNRFWDYHDVLYLRQGAENSGVFTTGNLKRYAREVQGVFNDFDLSKFDDCLDSGVKRPLIENLAQQAAASGISSTPTFTVNGALMAGAQPIEVFREAIKKAQDALAMPGGTPAATPTAAP